MTNASTSNLEEEEVPRTSVFRRFPVDFGSTESFSLFAADAFFDFEGAFFWTNAIASYS